MNNNPIALASDHFVDDYFFSYYNKIRSNSYERDIRSFMTMNILKLHAYYINVAKHISFDDFCELCRKNLAYYAERAYARMA